jgi:uncharacterized protein
MRDVILLERGSDELLLVDSFHLRPLYVRRGRARILQVLAEAQRDPSLEALRARFPGDAPLIELLERHGLVGRGGARPAVEASGPTPSGRKGRITLYLLITEACNLRCTYCLDGTETYDRRSPAGLSTETAVRAVETCLAELAVGGRLEVAFFGGEPLLRWPRVKEIIRACEDLRAANPDKKVVYHLTSNLTAPPEDLVEWVGRHGIRVLCGIDGPPDVHDRCRSYAGGGPSHARSAAAIRRLVDAGAEVTLRATVSSLNVHRLEEVAAHHDALGGATSLFVPLRPVNSDGRVVDERMLPDPPTLIASASSLGRRPSAKARLFPFNDFSATVRPGVRHPVACGAPHGTTYVVRTNGDVYPCIYLVGQPRYRLGNVAGALDEEPLARMMAELHVDRREECAACAWRYACGGGCLVMVQARALGPTRPAIAEYARAITCDFSRALLSASLWEAADAANSPRAEPGHSPA